MAHVDDRVIWPWRAQDYPAYAELRCRVKPRREPKQGLIILHHHLFHRPRLLSSSNPSSDHRSINHQYSQPSAHPCNIFGKLHRTISGMPGLTSAAGLIGLLDEPDQLLRCYALQKLDGLVDQFWPEIADSVSKMCVEISSALEVFLSGE